jgi:hypothetical protein
MKIDYLKFEKEILSRLNFQEEYKNLGIEILSKSEKNGNFLVRNPYNPDWSGECFVIGQGESEGSFVMRNGGKPVSISKFFDFSSDFLPGKYGRPNYAVNYYAKKMGIETSDFRVDSASPENGENKDPGTSTEIEKVASRVKSASAEEEASFKKQKESQKKKWEPPEDLNRPLPPAPDFPLEYLPNAFRDFVSDVSNRYQCPPDMVAIPLMVSTAGLIGSNVVFRPKQNDNWSERCCLWGPVIATKGSMKSPAMAEGTKNLRRIQDSLQKEDREIIKRWKERNEEFKARKKDSKLVSENQEKAEPKPIRRRIVVTDITVEKLVDIMWTSRGLTMAHDELAGFVLNLCRYHNGSDRQFYLQTHSGGSYHLDRITRGEQYVQDLYLNIVGLIQPSVAKVIFGEDDGDDGLFERFGLIAYPEKPKQFELVDESPNRAADEQLREVSDMLFSSTWNELLPRDGFGRHPFVRFDLEAQEIFNTWYVSHMNRLIKMDDDLLGGFYAKGQGLLARLVLLTHLTKWAESGGTIDIRTVSKETLEQCIDFFQKYLEPMWERIATGFSMSAADIKVQKIAGWIKDSATKRVTIREIKRKNWKDLNGDDEIVEAISELITRKWLGGLMAQKTKGRTLKYYPSNPLIWAK